MAGGRRLAVADHVVAERRGDVVHLEVVGVEILGRVEADDAPRRVGAELRRRGGVEVAGAQRIFLQLQHEVGGAAVLRRR